MKHQLAWDAPPTLNVSLRKGIVVKKVMKVRQVLQVRKGRQVMKVRKSRQVRKVRRGRKGKIKRDKSWVVKKWDSNSGRSRESRSTCFYRFWSGFMLLGCKGFCVARGTPPAGASRDGRPITASSQIA